MIGPPPPPPPGLNPSSDEDELRNWFGIPLSNEIVLKGHTKEGNKFVQPPCLNPSSDEDELRNWFGIPLSNEIVLKGHTKVVSALAVDHTGSRVLSGSYVCAVRMYEFQGMNSRLQSFQQLESYEGHQVRNLSWCPTADRFLCVTGSAQAKVIIPKFPRPGRVPVTTCALDHDGKCIASGIGDGSIQVHLLYWVSNIKLGWGSRPDVHIEKGPLDDITGSFDSSLKVWDLRKTKEALKVFEDLPNHYGQTTVAFSPNEQLFFTGTSVKRESSTGGLLCFFD